MKRKRLNAVGITLLVLGLVTLVFNFFARGAQRGEADALASRLDALSIRVDDSIALPEKDRDKDQLISDIEDVRGELTGIKHSHESLTSATNLSLFLYSALTITGSGCVIAGARLPQNLNQSKGG
tara:strand:- start:462 stop:836 length:375 start_codon:yes stop_codon:yes gene_type:complete